MKTVDIFIKFTLDFNTKLIKLVLELGVVPPSNDKVSHRICDKAGDILDSLIDRVKNSNDIGNLATVLVYVKCTGCP